MLESANWLDDRFKVAKKYGLIEVSPGLTAELDRYKKFWLDNRVPARESEPLSADTVNKRVSRILLYFGFLDLIKAARPTDLALWVCLNTEAVQMFIDWHQLARETKLSNLAENLSTFVSVGKFLGADDKVLGTLRTMRNRLQAKERLSKKKTVQDYKDNNKWLGEECRKKLIFEC